MATPTRELSRPLCTCHQDVLRPLEVIAVHQPEHLVPVQVTRMRVVYFFKGCRVAEPRIFYQPVRFPVLLFFPFGLDQGRQHLVDRELPRCFTLQDSPERGLHAVRRVKPVSSNLLLISGKSCRNWVNLSRPRVLSSNKICSSASLLWEETASGANPLDSAWRK